MNIVGTSYINLWKPTYRAKLIWKAPVTNYNACACAGQCVCVCVCDRMDDWNPNVPRSIFSWIHFIASGVGSVWRSHR